MRVIRLNLSRRLSEFSRLLFLGVVPLRGGRVDHEARPVAPGVHRRAAVPRNRGNFMLGLG